MADDSARQEADGAASQPSSSSSDSGSSSASEWEGSMSESGAEEDDVTLPPPPAASAPPSGAVAKEIEPRGMGTSARAKDSAAAEKQGDTRKRRRQRSRVERERAVLVHKAHLLCQLAQTLHVSSICGRGWLQARAVSLLSAAALPVASSLSAADVRRMVDWFRLAVKPDLVQQPKTDEEALVAALRGEPSHPDALVLAFVALARGAGLDCRVVRALHPVPFQRAERERQRAGGSDAGAKPAKRFRRQAPSADGTGAGAAREPVAEAEGVGSRVWWAEVLCREAERGESAALSRPRWVHVDPLRGAVDEPTVATRAVAAGTLRPGRRTVSRRELERGITHAVAVDGAGRAVDVTRRYAPRWSAVRRRRLPESTEALAGGALAHQPPPSAGWWPAALWQASHALKPDPSGARSALGDSARRDVADEVEGNEMLIRSQAEEVPTTLTALRDHPTYVAQRHLGKHEIIEEGARQVGSCKGEPVFLRSAVREARTERQWFIRGRVVREDEKVKPAKMYQPASRRQRAPPARGTASAGAGGESGDGSLGPSLIQLGLRGSGHTDATAGASAASSANSGRGGGGGVDSLPVLPVALFAEWQTDALAPPPLGPGDAVPVNEYGNIELWTPAHLPPGAVHVRGGRPAQAAKKLGIRYAPAMLGFEGQGRSARPVVEGIVVHESAEEAVRDASRAMEEQRAKKAATKREQRAVANWETLAKGLRVRAYMTREYGL